MKQETDHTYAIKVQVHNRPGVLVRIAQIFGRRGYNIDGLHVEPDKNDSQFSHITISAFGQHERIEQIVAQIKKLIDVVSVELKEK